MKPPYHCILIIIVLLLSFHSKAQITQTVVNGALSTAIDFPGAQCSYSWLNDKPEIGLAASGSGNIPAFKGINTTNSPITATVTATPGLSGMAYITNNYVNTVSVINLATNTIVTTLPVGNTPVGVAVNPINNQVYICNSFDPSVSVINTFTNTVKTNIAIGGYAYTVCVSPDGKRAYVPDYNKGTIKVINTTTNTIIATWPAGPNPFMMTCNSSSSILYVTSYDAGNNNNGIVTAINTQTGNIIAVIPVASQPFGVTISPDDKFVYVANFNSASISVINTGSNTVVATIPTGYGPRSILISPDGSTIYVRVGYDNKLVAISTSNFQPISTIQLVGSGSAGLSISPDGNRILAVNQVSNSVTVIDAQTNKIITTINLPSDGPASYGNFISGGNNCAPATFKITVNPSPNLSAKGTLTALSTTYGTPSPTTSFSVSASWLTSSLTLTSPDGFEISTDNISFSKNISIDNSNGSINSAIIYVRLSSQTPVGSHSGNIILKSDNLAELNVVVPESKVQAVVLTIKADNKSRAYNKPNPLLTATYSGFVNNENESQLTRLPAITTTADITSPAGRYSITAANAAATNYSFNYITGILNITEVIQETNLIIPNTFTPNGDGVNDVWNIKNLNTSGASTVTVFNRYGQQVFYSTGYAIPWDGRFNNNNLPTGIYYYIIRKNPHEPAIAGYVMLSR